MSALMSPPEVKKPNSAETVPERRERILSRRDGLRLFSAGIIYGRIGAFGRSGVAATPRLRLPPLEVFAQCQLEPVASRILHIRNGPFGVLASIARHGSPLKCPGRNGVCDAVQNVMRSGPARWPKQNLENNPMQSSRQPPGSSQLTELNLICTPAGLNRPASNPAAAPPAGRREQRSSARRDREPAARPEIGPIPRARCIGVNFTHFGAFPDLPRACARGALMARTGRLRGPVGSIPEYRACCRSSVVEHSIGNGEVDSSILSGSTSFSPGRSIDY